MGDPSAKLLVDRLDGNLRAVDASIAVVREHSARLRAAIAVSARPAVEAELRQYRDVSIVLEEIRKSAARAQLAIAKCKMLCAEMEVAAIEETTPPPNHTEQMASLTEYAGKETDELIKSTSHLRELISALPKDQGLPKLADKLNESAEALKETILLCQTSIVETAADVAKDTEVKPDPSKGAHHH